ncbi:MAG: GtrA family protein [Xanthomonadales bacterium]|nr:GtrA family protein [Xanthomonadales bacterium]
MRQILLFCVGGFIGFFIDAGLVQWLVSAFAANPYASRMLSFLTAATGTWLFNRRYTFKGLRHYRRFGEWSRYMFAMSGVFWSISRSIRPWSITTQCSSACRHWPSRLARWVVSWSIFRRRGSGSIASASPDPGSLVRLLKRVSREHRKARSDGSCGAADRGLFRANISRFRRACSGSSTRQEFLP